MRPRRQAISVVNATATVGMEVRGSTWRPLAKGRDLRLIQGNDTLRNIRQPGRPWSRAKDHVIRDDPARQAIVAQICKTTMMMIIVVAPAVEPVAW